VLDLYEGPKRIRRWYRSKTEAEAAADGVKAEHKAVGQSWLQLSPQERNDLMSVYAEAQKERITLRTVWAAHRVGKLDAAPSERRTLKQAIEETIRWRRAENLRERYLADLENYLNRFTAGRGEMYVDRIGVADLETWFAGRNEALATRKANMGRLGSLFDVCYRRGYVKDNP